MKRLFNVNKQSPQVDTAILILRIGIAVLMLTHGLPKVESLFSGDDIKFPSVMGMSPAVSLALAVFAEVMCSVFILFGFATRLAVMPLIITMLVAALVIHGGDPLAKQEPSLHYLLVYLGLLFTGSGRYSIDALLNIQTKDVRIQSRKYAIR